MKGYEKEEKEYTQRYEKWQAKKPPESPVRVFLQEKPRVEIQTAKWPLRQRIATAWGIMMGSDLRINPTRVVIRDWRLDFLKTKEEQE